MEPQEIDSALDELENRLDRLRSLYEQYFMGIEKIEPTVPRKDIDRRFWILRRTQIRNTARRFRLQTLVQRYNTFQQHWTRICREIENGTYVRHLLKAQKNLGAEPKTWAAKKRLGLLRKTAEGAARSSFPPADGAALAAAGTSSVQPPSIAEPAPRSPVPPRSPSAFPSVRPQNVGPLDLELEDTATPPRPRPSVPPVPAAAAASIGKPPLPARPGAVASATATVARPPMSSRPDAPRPPMPSRPDAPRPPMPSRPDAPRPPMPSRPDAPRPPIPSRPDAPRPASAVPLPAGRAPSTSPLPAKPVAPAQNAAPGARPPVAAPVRPAAPSPHNAAATPPAKAPAPPATGNVQAPAAARATTATSPTRPVAPASPDPAAGRAAAVRPVAPPAPAAPAAKPSSGLSDERVAQLHAELNAARRQLNQATSASMDSLAKTLRETESKLRSQHGGRAVDFQVVIKDGKPIVKPVVRRQG